MPPVAHGVTRTAVVRPRHCLSTPPPAALAVALTPITMYEKDDGLPRSKLDSKLRIRGRAPGLAGANHKYQAPAAWGLFCKIVGTIDFGMYASDRTCAPGMVSAPDTLQTKPRAKRRSASSTVRLVHLLASSSPLPRVSSILRLSSPRRHSFPHSKAQHQPTAPPRELA